MLTNSRGLPHVLAPFFAYKPFYRRRHGFGWRCPHFFCQSLYELHLLFSESDRDLNRLVMFVSHGFFPRTVLTFEAQLLGAPLAKLHIYLVESNSWDKPLVTDLAITI